MSRTIMENAESQKLERESFEYRRLGKMRFIGHDAFGNDKDVCKLWRSGAFSVLINLLPEYGIPISDNCGFCGLMHHNGGSHGDENFEWHFVGGYFFKADTPVPEGFSYLDIPTESVGYAVYVRESTEHETEPAYQFTRDQILSDGFLIPYPQAYWYATIYENGWEDLRFGYLMPVNELK